MTHRHQRGWLKKEKRSHGETWVLFFRTVRKSDGKRVQNKIPGTSTPEDRQSGPPSRNAWFLLAGLGRGAQICSSQWSQQLVRTRHGGHARKADRHRV